jgi:hypothetical protein
MVQIKGRRLEKAVQTTAACQTSEKTGHETATSTAAAVSSLIIVGVVALRRRVLAVRTLLRRIRALAGGKGLLRVAHLRRSLLIVTLRRRTARRGSAALLVWILLVAAVCRLRGTWGRTVGRRFVLLEGHCDSMRQWIGGGSCSRVKNRLSGTRKYRSLIKKINEGKKERVCVEMRWDEGIQKGSERNEQRSDHNVTASQGPRS